MSRCLLLIAMLAVACGGAAPTATVPTTMETPSTSVASTRIVPTSTSGATSTTDASATITAPLAEFPLVVSGSGLLGYNDGTHWVPGDAVFEVEGGEEYEVVNLSGVVDTAIGSSLQICEPSQTPMIELDPPLPVSHNEAGAIAVAGSTWDLVPRPVASAGDPPADLMAAAVSFLANRGLDDPDPGVAQYLKFDLEGDGADEEILIVRRIPDDLFGNADSYSLVLMRKMLDIEEATLVIEFSQGAADNAYVVSHVVSAIVDLNGDGKMEIVVDGRYYEGSGTTAWEYRNDDLGPVLALAAGCGA